jgi:NAD(P)-dependent dehydrogenase (short-subunit alcohol dehydrogenase family)
VSGLRVDLTAKDHLMEIDLTGTVAVVTGGSRGLGREMVLALARCGADVVIASRKLGACQIVAEQVEAETGRRALPIACHVGRWEDLRGFVDDVYAEFSRVDVLVNNAGMAPLYASLPEVTEDLFDKVINVNLKAPFRLSALIGDRMSAGAGGSIINISSVAAVHPQPTNLPYAAAKAGLETLTLGFANALGPNVRVNSIAVGPFLTDIAKSWDVDAFEAFARRHYALGRLGRPEEIVGTMLYLASDLSTFTTGATIRVDGGVSNSSPFPDE